MDAMDAELTGSADARPMGDGAAAAAAAAVCAARGR